MTYERGIEWRFRKVDGRWQRRHPDGGPWLTLTVYRPAAEAPTSLRGTRPVAPRTEWIWT